MSMTLDTLPERPSYIRNADEWEAACQRNGAILLPCGICDYHGEVPWDPLMAESGQWHCPQCDRLRPFLDFNRLWLVPGRKIRYASWTLDDNAMRAALRRVVPASFPPG